MVNVELVAVEIAEVGRVKAFAAFPAQARRAFVGAAKLERLLQWGRRRGLILSPHASWR